MSIVASIHDYLVGQGIPVVTVRSSPVGVEVVYDTSATPEQVTTGNAYVANLDLSEAGQSTILDREMRKLAKATLTAPSPTERATRNALRIVYQSITQTRQKVNELVTWANANGASMTPLQIRSWEQILDAVRQQIDTET